MRWIGAPMRGEFIRGDGLVVPNNVSLDGKEMILASAFQHASQTFYAALVAGAATLDMTMGDMTEPTIGTNGYARVAISQDDTGWPVIANLDSEMYVETDWLTYTASGGNFDETVQRIALVAAGTYTAGDSVFALSGLFPAEIIITPTTDLALRRFKYRFYL